MPAWFVKPSLLTFDPSAPLANALLRRGVEPLTDCPPCWNKRLIIIRGFTSSKKAAMFTDRRQRVLLAIECPDCGTQGAAAEPHAH
jgi:hypothetical protein